MKNKSVLNLTFNILSLVISMGLSFWITPYIIKNIGAESYAFVPLTQQLVNYMTVITVSITSIAGRFFTVAKKQGNRALQQEYFSSTLSASLVGSVLLCIPLIIIATNISKVLKVPNYLISDVRLSFLLYSGIFIMTFVTSVFNVGAFSSNKLYITSSINIVNIIVRTVSIVLLLTCFVPRIWFVSAGALTAAAFTILATIIMFKKIEPHISIKKLGFKRLGEILSSGAWASLSEIGVILFLQIDLLVANWNLSGTAAGEYSVALQLPTILRTFSGTIISIFIPTIISLFAIGKIKDMIKYVNNAVKYTGLVLSLPIGLVSGLGSSVLAIWINESYRSYGLILAILTIHLSINLSIQTVMSVQTAVNKLKTPAFVTLIMGTINFILAYALSGYFKLGAMGIAIAGSVVLTAKNLIFTPLYVAKITNQKWNTYLKGVIKPFLATIFVAFISYNINILYNIDTFLKLFLACAIVSVIYIIFAYTVMLKSSERSFITKKIRSII